jgi:hypothetical protein
MVKTYWRKERKRLKKMRKNRVEELRTLATAPNHVLQQALKNVEDDAEFYLLLLMALVHEEERTNFVAGSDREIVERGERIKTHFTFSAREVAQKIERYIPALVQSGLEVVENNIFEFEGERLMAMIYEGNRSIIVFRKERNCAYKNAQKLQQLFSNLAIDKTLIAI